MFIYGNEEKLKTKGEMIPGIVIIFKRVKNIYSSIYKYRMIDYILHGK